MSDKIAPINGGVAQGGDPLLLRPREAARVLGISKSTLFALLADGRLPRRRIGKRSVGIPLDARGERAGYREADFKAAMRVLLVRGFIKALGEDPATGTKHRSPRLYRIKPGWFVE